MAFVDVFGKGNEELKNEMAVVKDEVAALDTRTSEENIMLKTQLLAARKEVTDVRKENNILKSKQVEMENEQVELKNEQGELKHRLKLIEEMLIIRKEEEKHHEEEIISNAILDAKFKDEWITVKNMCHLLKMKNETKLRYYLYECGVYDIKINIDRNTFSINYENLSVNPPDFIKDKYKIEDDKLILHIDLVEYFETHSADITESYKKSLRKSAKYKESKKELESKIVEDYQAKINQICGTDRNGGYNKERWGKVYNVFRKSYPTLDNNYNSYKDEFGYISKVKYVVTEMGLGNYLLKIACELYA